MVMIVLMVMFELVVKLNWLINSLTVIECVVVNVVEKEERHSRGRFGRRL